MITKIHNIQFEQTVICSLMTVQGAYEIVSGAISERTFYAERHKLIFQAIKKLIDQGKPCTEGFVDGYLNNDEELYKKIGGEEYLMQILTDALNDSFNIEFYISELNRLADHRDIESISKQMFDLANDTSMVDVFSEAESLLVKSDSTVSAKKTSFDAKESMQALIERMSEKANQTYGGDDCYGVRFGLPSLDEKIGSIDAGHFCIIAGREGSGKSTLAQILAVTNMLRYGKSCLFVTAEMDKETLMARMLSAYSRVPFKNIQRGIVYDGMFEEIATATQVIDTFKLIVEEKQMPTISDIRSYIRRAKRRYPDLGLVVIDYIGLIKDPTQRDRRLEMDSISRNLKAMGKEFGVPMIVLAQLNRENVKVNREPKSSDLKESGQLEADCDQIILVHPVVENEEPTGTTKLIVSKNRHGEKGFSMVKNRLDICKFVDIQEE